MATNLIVKQVVKVLQVKTPIDMAGGKGPRTAQQSGGENTRSGNRRTQSGQQAVQMLLRHQAMRSKPKQGRRRTGKCRTAGMQTCLGTQMRPSHLLMDKVTRL